MNAEEAKKRVMASITEITDGEVEPTEEMNLIGKDARLDSMKLVELCLSLEDQAGDIGFAFDWTSELDLIQISAPKRRYAMSFCVFWLI